MKIFNLIKCSYVSLVKDKMKSFLSILGIIIGVLTVVTVLSISDAAKLYVLNELDKVGSSLMWVMPDPSKSQGIDLTLSDVEPLNQLSFIENSSPYIAISEVLNQNGREGRATVVGVNANYKILRNMNICGRFICDVDTQEYNRICVVSDTIRKKYLSSNLDPCGSTIKLSGLEYTVVGYIAPNDSNTQTGLDEDEAIYIPYSSFCKHYGCDRIDMYMFSVNDNDSVKNYKTLINQNMIGVNQRLPIKIGSVSESAENMKFLFNIVTCVTILITAVSLLVSGIGIMNVLLMSITERKWEIGLRKALGADNKSILLQFLTESLLLCITGAVIGLIISEGVIIALSYFIKINIQLSCFALIVSVSFCCLIGLFFGIFPAMKAAKFEPLECLEQ